MDISPHIVVADAAAAADWYAKAFGFEEVSRLAVPDGRYMSIVLRYGSSQLHLCDPFPEMGVTPPAAPSGALALNSDDGQGLWDRATEAGAQVLQPLSEGFWGALHGQLTDPFGYRWNVDQQLREVPLAEQERAVAALFGG
jgi:PhnB protein